MSGDLFDNLRNRLAERGHDRNFPGAATIMQRAAVAHAEIRATRDAIRSDKNLSPEGQRKKLVEHLEKAAPALQKYRRQIDRACADIDKKRAGMRPKFEKVDPAILIAVAAKIATMSAAEQARLLSRVDEKGDPKIVDPICAQAVLDLPPIVSSVNEQIRGILEKDLIEKSYGPALAALNDEAEAWSTAESALRTATAALQEAGEFPSPHAFNTWLEKVAPPNAHELAAEARESDAFASEAILIAAEGLAHDARMKLHSNLLDQATAHLNRGGE